MGEISIPAPNAEHGKYLIKKGMGGGYAGDPLFRRVNLRQTDSIHCLCDPAKRTRRSRKALWDSGASALPP